MNPQETNWIPGLLVLGAGAVSAILYLLLSRKQWRASGRNTEGTREDLEQRAQLLIQQIKELKADSHGLSPERYEAEKSRLEQEAAQAFRARDKQAANRSGPQSAPLPPPTRKARIQSALWALGVVLFFGVLGYLLVSEQRPREEDAMATGKRLPAAKPDEEDPQFLAAVARAKAQPFDLENVSMVAHELIRKQQFAEAQTLTLRSLSIDPFHVESRVHRAVLRAAEGDLDPAVADLQHIVDLYPGGQEGLLFLGSIKLRRGDRQGALENFERFAIEVPRDQQPPQLMQAIAQLRNEMNGLPTP